MDKQQKQQRMAELRRDILEQSEWVTHGHSQLKLLNEVNTNSGHDGSGKALDVIFCGIDCMDSPLNEGTLNNIRHSIIEDMEYQIDGWSKKVEEMKKELEELKPPVAITVYNRALEIDCPHCNHGTYVNTDDTIYRSEVVSCQHCGGEYTLSEEIIEQYCDVNVSDSVLELLSKVREKIALFEQTSYECDSLIESFDNLYKAVSDG